jgi:surfactin synthase thioesterase subunit
LRADLEAAETYQCMSCEDMPAPITAFLGLDDPLALPHAVAQWSLHTFANFTMRCPATTSSRGIPARCCSG